MRIAIVGASSMAGSRLQAHMATRHSIVTVGRGVSDELRLDLTSSYTRVADAGTFDAVVHCAASFGGDDLEQALQNELTNAVGALRVAQFARDTRCAHVVYISTVWAVNENVAHTSYSLSKRHGQECLEWACRQEKIGFTALQPSQLYDEFGQARKHQRLLYHIIDCARAGRDFTLYGTKDPVRNYLFAPDLVRIVEAVLENQILGCFPVVHPALLRVSEIGVAAYQVFGKGGMVVRDPGMPDLAEYFFPEDYRIYERTGLWPAVDLRSGISLVARHAYAAAQPVPASG